MNFFSFAARSFLLSFAVALFWLPVLAMTFYGIYLVFDLMKDELLGFFMIFVIIFFPLQVLLGVLAVRGGMTILKVTKGSDLAKLMGVTWRTLRFNGLISVVIVNLFTWATVITGLKIMQPEFIDEFWRIRGSTGNYKGYYLLELFQGFPIVLWLGSTLGSCVALAALSVNFAATSATAVDNPPGHHQLWGVGAQFKNLFLLGVVFLMIPHIGMVFLSGGLSATAADAENISDTILIISAVYNLWTICLFAAAAAIGYKIHLGDDEVRRKRDIEELAGVARSSGPQVDIAALRRARMGGQLVSVEDMLADDDDDEDDEYDDEEDEDRRE